MKRRPTAEDRELLAHGDYTVNVEEDGKRLYGFGLAQLKPEGGVIIRLDDRTITMSPVDSQSPSP